MVETISQEDGEEIWQDSQWSLGRQLSQIAACSAEPDKCVDNCFYKFIERGCYGPDAQQPGQMIAGLGAKDAEIEKYPFMLSLRIPRVDNSDDGIVPNCYSHICGAVLIWRDIALTAAHCLVNDRQTLITDDNPHPKFKTTLHVTRFSKCRHQDGQEQIFAQEAIVHPEYDQTTFNNDIAIIKLRGDMSTEYGFINLWTSQQDENLWDTKVLGFGATVLEKKFNNETTRLQVANVATMMFEACKSWFVSINETLSVNKLNKTTMLCTQSYAADTCKGDSGGPLFLQEDDINVSLIGIASWGSARQCEIIDQGQPPSVFARIAFYKDWIIKNVNQLTVYGPYNAQPDAQDDAVSTTTLSPVLDLPSTPNFVLGTLLKELTILRDLEELDMGQISTIPKEISVLTNLKVLDLNLKDVTGTIPNQLSTLTNLNTLSLNDNRLTGTIPKEVSALTKIWFLILFNNGLTGTIPKELSALTNLEMLVLSNNDLTGVLPIEFSVLTSADIFLN